MKKGFFIGAYASCAVGAICLLSAGVDAWDGNVGAFFGLLAILTLFGAVLGGATGWIWRAFKEGEAKAARGEGTLAQEIGDASRGNGTWKMGLVLSGCAIAWFTLGLMANRVYFYPPVLLVFGLISVARGLSARSPAPSEEALGPPGDG